LTRYSSATSCACALAATSRTAEATSSLRISP
jgi:hypothetical protein